MVTSLQEAVVLCPEPQHPQLCWMSAVEVAQDFRGVRRRALAELFPSLPAFCGMCCLSLFLGTGEPDVPPEVLWETASALALYEIPWEGVAARLTAVLVELGRWCG